MYKALYNNPSERAFITYSWVYWDNGFTHSELLSLEQMCTNSTEDAKTIGTENLDEVRKIRRSKIKFYDRTDSSAWIFDKFNSIISVLNDRYYNFDLNGYNTFQYTEYEGSDQGTYDWHIDLIHDTNNDKDLTRKLSCVLMLNEQDKDFVGGNFEICHGNNSMPSALPMPKGRLIAFPSYIAHRVTPVTSGKRKTIVIWVTGPKFR